MLYALLPGMDETVRFAVKWPTVLLRYFPYTYSQTPLACNKTNNGWEYFAPWLQARILTRDYQPDFGEEADFQVASLATAIERYVSSARAYSQSSLYLQGIDMGPDGWPYLVVGYAKSEDVLVKAIQIAMSFVYTWTEQQTGYFCYPADPVDLSEGTLLFPRAQLDGKLVCVPSKNIWVNLKPEGQGLRTNLPYVVGIQGTQEMPETSDSLLMQVKEIVKKDRQW